MLTWFSQDEDEDGLTVICSGNGQGVMFCQELDPSCFLMEDEDGMPVVTCIPEGECMQ